MIIEAVETRRVSYGWVVVGAAFVLMGVGYGLIYALGDYAEPFASAFGADRAAVSFAFGLAAILSLTGGALAGPLADRVGPRPLALGAALAYLVGLGLASRASQLWQVYLTASAGAGLGTAAVYVPAVASVQRCFVRNRGRASLIATSGLGAGTLLGPLCAGWLIAGHGWRTALVVTGLAGAALTALAGVLMVRDSGPGRGGAPDRSGLTLVDSARTRDFRWLYLAMIGTCAVAFFGYGHIVSYAEGRGVAPVTATLGLAAVGAGSWLGRLSMAAVTEWLGLRTSFAGSIGALAPVMLAWLVLPVPPLASLLVVGFALGTAFGVFVALCPTVIAGRFGQRALSTVIGVVYTGAGVGALLGPWLGGLAFDGTGSYHLANLGAMATALLAATAAARVGRNS